MRIETEIIKENIVVTVTGRIDAITNQEFESNLSSLIAQGRNKFLLDFSNLQYISSAGLRSILSIAKQVKPKGGSVIFYGLAGPVKDVFKIAGFGTLFKIFATRGDALG
jgi:anti-anti-sigma factor